VNVCLPESARNTKHKTQNTKLSTHAQLATILALVVEHSSAYTWVRSDDQDIRTDTPPHLNGPALVAGAYVSPSVSQGTCISLLRFSSACVFSLLYA
jgi:hypothetical protein